MINSNESFKTQIMAQQLAIYIRLRKLDDKLNSRSRCCPNEAYLDELRKEAEDLLKNTTIK